LHFLSVKPGNSKWQRKSARRTPLGVFLILEASQPCGKTYRQSG
jgi:hypothetical protein